MSSRNLTARRLMLACALGAVAAVAAPAASASPVDPSGVLKLVPKPRLSLNASQSSNWFGYNLPALGASTTLFNSITGDWVVPTATQHNAGKAESSADWIGIGGGCINTGCSVTDPTGLIQTGTEQDVDAAGHATYAAWWELVPVPEIAINNFVVGPGDHMHAAIAEVVSNSELWTITLKDLTRGETFTTTVPYPSSHLSAEWIEETPLEIGTGGAALAGLPNLTETPFSGATVNGHSAGLTPASAIDLVNNGTLLGSVSNPFSTGDGFGACTYTASCPVP